MLMTTLTIKLQLSDEALARLQQEAQRRNVSIDMVISETLEESFDELNAAELLGNLRTAMQQAQAGNYRSAHEVLDEIERETVDDAGAFHFRDTI
jgi:predicted transcriptional regulator